MLETEFNSETRNPKLTLKTEFSNETGNLKVILSYPELAIGLHMLQIILFFIIDYVWLICSYFLL